MRRLPIALSAAALVIAVFGGTPLGHAVSQLYADNSDRVDGYHATGSPQANKIVALNGSANLPTGALPPGTLRGSIAKSDSTLDSARNKKWVLVECPAGMWATGGGYAIDNPDLGGVGGSVVVTTNAPANAGAGNPPAFGWYVAAEEIPATSDPNATWQLNAWVVCVNHQP